jgi:ABC-2 type transport system ATP-binding protein
MSGGALELRDVHKSFGSAIPLAGLDLAVHSGEVVGFLGPNGAGKTTTMRILLGLLPADRGHVRVLGLDPRSSGNEVRAAVGAVLDHDGLYDRLTAQHNLELHADLRGLASSRQRVEELLRKFGLWDRRSDRVSKYSKGMRQKLAVARALLHRPKLLLLDEPFTGLDPSAAIDLRVDLGRLATEDGTAILVATHDLHHVEKACHKVVFLKGGRAVHAGTTSELAAGVRGGVPGERPGELELYVCGDGLTRELLVKMESEGAHLGAASENDGFVVRCTTAQHKSFGSQLVRQGVDLTELTPRRRSIEEAFVSIVAGSTVVQPPHADEKN